MGTSRLHVRALHLRRGDAIGPVPTVEDKSPTLRLASRLSMLAVLYGSEGVGVVFFSSLMFLRSDNRQRSQACEVGHTTPLRSMS
jgi:hypothetical protein